MTEATLTHPEIKTLEVAAKTRVSIRKYQDAPIPHADLERILDIAHRAPTAFNTQPTRFVVVTNPELKAKLQAAAYGQPQVGSAPAVFVVYSDMEDVLATAEQTANPAFGEEGKAKQRATLEGGFAARTVEQRAEWANAQANIVLGYLLLTIETSGYVSSPMLGFDPAQVRAALELPAHVQIAALVAVGKPAAEGIPQFRLPLERIVTWK
jgi:nitroreductase